MNIDWNKYNELYPDRYRKKTQFDINISKMIDLVSFFKKKIQLTILDIGSGTKGTVEMMKRAHNHVYSLDPYIDKIPEFYLKNIDWNHSLRFDIILCRGSFNYLSKDEIKKIPYMLKDDGILMFNTFKEPTSISRSYTVNGEYCGIEETRFDKTKKILYHLLMQTDGVCIDHEINYYSSKDIEEMFSDCIINMDSVKNSVYYIIQKKRV